MEEGGTLVIEEPAPPEPEETEVVPAEAPTPKPERRHRRPLRTEPAATPEPAPEPVEPPLAEVPALEPLESQEQQSALRNQVVTLQENLRQRIQQLNRQGLDPAARRTLEDARAFLSQSGRALEDEDLQRSLILARKASLLVSALEKER
jgi:hypothetical protein